MTSSFSRRLRLAAAKKRAKERTIAVTKNGVVHHVPVGPGFEAAVRALDAQPKITVDHEKRTITVES